MILPAIPDNERERLDALYSYGLLDTEPESDFEDLVRLASNICETPMSLITLIDKDRQWFKAKVGIDIDQTHREIAFCAHTIHHDELMVVEDATKDPRFNANPLVTGNPDIRFYAGMPLSTPTGLKLGTLCVIDSNPHRLTDLQRSSLEILGHHAMKLIELRRRNEEMKRLSQLHKRLLSIIGHDLRGPVNSIHSMLGLAMDDDLPVEEFKTMLPSLQTSIHSTSMLLNNLLEWASSQLTGRRVFKKPIPLKKVVDQISEATHHAFHLKQNELRNELNESDIVLGDRHMTEFILRNLIANANKFMDDGTVTIRRILEPDHIVIQVTDTGNGIPDHILPYLFHWETRTTTLGSHGERGSGLGLPMCNEFANSQGGSLTVESLVGTGTTFHLRLPTT